MMEGELRKEMAAEEVRVRERGMAREVIRAIGAVEERRVRSKEERRGSMYVYVFWYGRTINLTWKCSSGLYVRASC